MSLVPLPIGEAGSVGARDRSEADESGSKIGIGWSQRALSEADSTASSHIEPSGVKSAKPNGCTGVGRGTTCLTSPCDRCPGWAWAAASAPAESKTSGSGLKQDPPALPALLALDEDVARDGRGHDRRKGRHPLLGLLGGGCLALESVALDALHVKDARRAWVEAGDGQGEAAVGPAVPGRLAARTHVPLEGAARLVQHAVPRLVLARPAGPAHEQRPVLVVVT
eukprot:scaffold13728_cov90-Isochrysis_galbana.AAC.2